VAYGNVFCVCSYCGTQVRAELTEFEANAVAKLKGYRDAITAAIHCIGNKDYKSAQEYADKAAEMVQDDSAPMLIKYVAFLDSDSRKAASFLSMAQGLKGKSANPALSDEDYRGILCLYVQNYLSDREADIKRMFANMKKVKPADLNNVLQYENLKRMRQFFSDPELKDAFIVSTKELVDDCNKDNSLSGQMNQSTWDAIEDAHDNRVFKVASTVFVDPSIAPSATQYLSKYSKALDQKWEVAIKRGEVSGSKDQIRDYRAESDSLIAWMKTIR